MILSKNSCRIFSIDRKGHVVDSKGKGKEMMSDDQDAYDLIMKNKELLLECDPKQSPVRFIFLIQHFGKDGIIRMYFRFVR